MSFSIYRIPAILRFWRQYVLDCIKGARSTTELTSFRCNICGRKSKVPTKRLGREQVTCRCGSTVRFRSIVHVLSVELLGKSVAIQDMPDHRDLIGLDMSGAATYALPLEKRFGYINTFLHKPPILDITSPGNEWISRCDFLISSDVFEHVTPPVSRAFKNALLLLKPGGLFVITVPYKPEGATLEHFPDLYDFHLETRAGKTILSNLTRDGQIQEFDDLVFHGGEGETLEMRVFSLAGVLGELKKAGFRDIRVHSDACPEFGIVWLHPWSLPISARRPQD